MKILFGAAAAVMMLAGAAMAQTDSATPAAQLPPANMTTQCAAIGAEPTIPDGAVATVEQVNAANAAYQAWGEATRASLECRRVEVQQQEANLRGLLDQHNAAAARLNAVTQSWQTESAEFCARRGSRCTQEGQGQTSERQVRQTQQQLQDQQAEEQNPDQP